ncbi:MAG: hypothetical protein LBM20_03885 [Rikenellaceae bacterium]|nr:hypothetical protein [Rikenellaceae bacterium]
MGILLVGCRDFSFTSFMRGEPLATVGDKKLYAEDVQTLFAGMTPEDSLKLLSSYVDSWVKQQLKIQQAELAFPDDQERITRMVDDYRNSLLIYEYEKQYIDQRLDTAVSAGEIQAYYETHPDEFRLTVPLIKGVVVRFPVGFRQEGQMRIMALSGRADRLQDLVDVAMKNNLPFREFTDWVELGEMTAFLPRQSEAESARMLASAPFYEVTQGDNRHFIVMTDVLQAGSLIPLSRAQSTIRTLIVARRKQELVRQMEDDLLNNALLRKEVRIEVDSIIAPPEAQPIEEILKIIPNNQEPTE